jgi:hypothetical protein
VASDPTQDAQQFLDDTVTDQPAVSGFRRVYEWGALAKALILERTC